MTPARWVNVALVVVYLVLAVLYAADRSAAKVVYWIGAAIISSAVLMMR
jgi:hypothetical protein